MTCPCEYVEHFHQERTYQGERNVLLSWQTYTQLRAEFTHIVPCILRCITTPNTLLVLPPEHTSQGEPKKRFKYGFMHSPQDRIETKCFAVSRVLVLRLEHGFYSHR